MTGNTGILERLYSLQGKVALVTGGSRGIGEMIARGFVEAGVRTYISSRDPGACTETEQELSALGECVALPADLSTTKGIESLTSRLAEREDKLDILVNNAGAVWAESLDTYPEAGWDKVVDLDLKSPFFLTQALLPLLRAAASDADPARIVNIASMHGLVTPDVENYAYSAAKAGLIHLTRHLASNLASDRVTVNAIAPGWVATRMMRHVDAEELSARVPLGRPGRFEDLAGTAIYLCSPAGAWVTGATLTLDGGSVAHG